MSVLAKLRRWLGGVAPAEPIFCRTGSADDHEPSEIERLRELEIRILMLTWM
jgi:hypothetical protein